MITVGGDFVHFNASESFEFFENFILEMNKRQNKYEFKISSFSDYYKAVTEEI